MTAGPAADMPMNASTGRQDRDLTLALAQALARSARILRLRESARSLCLEQALGASRWAATPAQARTLAFGRLVQLFLADERQTQAGAAPNWGAGGGFVSRRGAPPLAFNDRAPPSSSIDALGGLAPLERAALALVAVEQFSYAEAARMLALGPREMADTLARAREAFAARLAAGAAGRARLRLVE